MKLLQKTILFTCIFLLLTATGSTSENYPIDERSAKEQLIAGNLNSSLEIYNQLIKTIPESSEIWNNRGVVLLRMGQCHEALDSFEKTISLNSSLESARINAAEASVCLGNSDQAIQYLQEAIDLDLKNPNLWKKLGSYYQKKGDLNKTIDSYTQAFLLNTSDNEIQYLLAETYYLAGQYHKSGEIYSKIITHSPDDENAWYNLGVNYEAMQQYKSAIDAYNTTISINSSNYKAWANMGNIYWRHNRYAEAQEAMKRVVKLHPNSDSYFDLAMVEKSLGNLNESQELFNKASSLAPNDTLKKAYAEKYDRLHQQINPDTQTTPSSANPIWTIICGLTGVALILKFRKD